jgi:hypothetical protein
MDDKIKVVYSWIGPKGPLWNTELPNVMSLACASENAQVDSRFFMADSVWQQMFSQSPELYDMYPSYSITEEDDRPFIIPYTLMWRVDFATYFCGRTGLLEFAHVPWHLIRLVRNKNGYILIDHGVEAHMSHPQIIGLHSYFGTIHGIPLHKIIYLTGAVNAKEIYNDYCEEQGIPDEPNHRLTIIPYASSAYIFRSNLVNPEDEPAYDTEVVPEKLFLMWNRRYRVHRLETVMHLENLGLIERSYVSFSKENIERPVYTFLNEATHQRIVERYGLSPDVLERFNNKLPLVLDGEDQIQQMCGDDGNLSRPYYQNSLVSIVTETNFKDMEVTLTEKSFKPFKEKHPFILVAGAGALQFLRDIGFKTFSEFWPEDYDQSGGPEDRIKRIVEVIKVIASWTPEQIIDFRRRVKPILEHNFNIIKNLDVTPLMKQIHDIVKD